MFIKSQCKDYKVERLCEVLSVSRSAYYCYVQGHTYVQSNQKQEELNRVKACFESNKHRYGSRRISHVLKDLGRHAVRSRMKELDLKAIQPRSFVPKTTNSNHKLGYSPNILAGYKVDAPHRVYVGDITYLPKSDGKWLYMSTWMDLHTRKIVGWKVDTHMQESIVINALKQAFHKHNPTTGLMIHSDRGGQYASLNFRKLLSNHHCIQSMSEAENPYDNAHMESFFSRFKAESMQKVIFEDKKDAEEAIFEYIEMYYNTQRIHSSLNYFSPSQYEKLYYENLNKNDSFVYPPQINKPDSLRGDGIPSSVLNNICN